MAGSQHRTLLRNANVLQEGGQWLRGDVEIRDDKISAVGVNMLPPADGDDVLDCTGLTVMSGLCDAHTHLSWLDTADFESIDHLPVEEHVLAAVANAKTYLDYGYTMCVGAASAKLRLDVVIRNAINAGKIPGPHYLANGPEISTTGSYIDQRPTGQPVAGFGLIADGPDEVRKQTRLLVKQGVDLIKLGISGEEVVGRPGSRDTIMDAEEVGAAVDEARKRGVRVCAHARSAGAVRLCIEQNVPIIYHASFIDDASIEALIERKSEFFVVPSLSFILRLVEGDGERFGLPLNVAQRLYQHEVDAAVSAMRKLKSAGVRVLPGGDYGFAWTPHGTYARDLEYFVDLLGFSPAEAIDAATVLGGEIMGDPHMGRVAAGYNADLLIVDGDPLSDIRILQDKERMTGVMKGGCFHRRPVRA
ncbi:metal-dependent hydrolase family protein [Nevskia ramosa]|uniref:metal-dependent hydrolase family protein n=1 Tax=Nevskia ramosa TaxID=64002 RepID=UPI0023568B17|nr:amidohydrolase family protein [Nevskia ramosa]